MKLCILLISMLTVLSGSFAASTHEVDVFSGEGGEIRITFIGHGTLMIQGAGKVIHIDPWSQMSDYTALPKADLILVTHEHRDHLDAPLIKKLRTADTVVLHSDSCSDGIEDGKVMNNYDTHDLGWVKVEAFPAYNIKHKRETGVPFHPRGRGNAYLLTLLGKRILVGGDTENVPELKELKNIDIAFFPMNLPYTMNPEMVADLALAVKPRILYPYHFGETDTSRITELLKGEKAIEVRIRKMK